MRAIHPRRHPRLARNFRDRATRDYLLEALEDRVLLDARGLQGLIPPAMAVATAGPAGAFSGASQNTLDALRADPTITTIGWQGGEYLAKAGQWITRFDGVAGAPDKQLGTINAELTAAGLPFHAARHLGSDGIVLR